ncbi:MAG: hypothetical protein OXT51_03605 [Chloroflexota bacterium]|nr:hypothetical protein [Chloroflexota bacterium]
MRTELSIEIKQVAVCLFVVAAALIAVGVISGTLARHVVQIIPLVLVFGLIPRWPAAGAWAAVGALGLWFAAMALVWAYLLGLSDIASGSYTNVEVFLTIVIAGCSAHGAQKAVQGGRGIPLAAKAAALAGGLVVQFAFVVASLQLFA